MLRYLLLGLLLTCVCSCRNKVHYADKTNNADTSLKILTYGLPDREQQRAMNTIAKRYGFHYYPVAGCVVSEDLLDSVNKENKRVNNILEQRFGKSWRLTFAAQVDTVQTWQRKVEEIVKKEDYIKNKEKTLEKEGNGLEYLIEPNDNSRTFSVKAYGWGQWNGVTELVVYYKLTVDLTKKTITKDSDVVEKLYNRS